MGKKGLKIHFGNVAMAAQSSGLLTLESDGRSLTVYWDSQGTQLSGILQVPIHLNHNVRLQYF